MSFFFFYENKHCMLPKCFSQELRPFPTGKFGSKWNVDRLKSSTVNNPLQVLWKIMFFNGKEDKWMWPLNSFFGRMFSAGYRSRAASYIFLPIIKNLFFYMLNTNAVWTFLQMDGWFALVWIQDDEHSNVIQIKNAFFFFHFAPIWCLTSLFQHVNHRGDQWGRWIRSVVVVEVVTEVWVFKKTKVMLCFIWFHLSFFSCWCLSSGRGKLHMGSSHKTWGRMLCVSDRERCFHHPAAALSPSQLALT